MVNIHMETVPHHYINDEYCEKKAATNDVIEGEINDYQPNWERKSLGSWDAKCRNEEKPTSWQRKNIGVMCH